MKQDDFHKISGAFLLGFVKGAKRKPCSVAVKTNSTHFILWELVWCDASVDTVNTIQSEDKTENTHRCSFGSMQLLKDKSSERNCRVTFVVKCCIRHTLMEILQAVQISFCSQLAFCLFRYFFYIYKWVELYLIWLWTCTKHLYFQTSRHLCFMTHMNV